MPSRVRLTTAAEEALHLAEYEAHAAGVAYVGDGQLLVGLIGARDGIAAEILAAAGVTLGEARNRLRAVVRPKADRLNGRLPWTPHLTWILRSADQGDGAVDSGRLLELLLAEEEGVARFILSDMADLDAVRAELGAVRSARPPET